MQRLTRTAAALAIATGLALGTTTAATADAIADSVAVVGTPAGIAVTSDATRVYATDYAAELDSRSLSVVDTSTNEYTQIGAGRSAAAVALTSDDARLYVANALSEGTVSVIELATNEIVATVPVGAYPQSMALAPGDRRLWVANFGRGGAPSTVSVIDAATLAVTATITVGAHPTAVALAPSGTHAWVANAMLPGELSRDERLALQEAAETGDPAETPAPTPGPDAPGEDGEPAPSPAEPALPTGNVSLIDTRTNTVFDSVTVGDWPTDIALTPDGSQAWVTNGDQGTVSVIDAATHRVSATVPVGAWPSDVAITADGSRAYVTCTQSNVVQVIDVRSASVISTIDVERPKATAISADATRAWVTSQGSNVLTVIDLDVPPAFTTLALDDAFVGQVYNAPITLTGAHPQVALASGSLPSGLALDPDTGEIYGTPTTPGTSSFALTATATVAGAEQSVTADFHLTVARAAKADPAPAHQTTAMNERRDQAIRATLWMSLALVVAVGVFLGVRRLA